MFSFLKANAPRCGGALTLLSIWAIAFIFCADGRAAERASQSSKSGASAAPERSVHLDVTPERGLVDEPITVRVRGLEQGQRVTLSAHAIDALDVSFSSRAVFVAGELGDVDTSKQAPIEGTYASVASSGLLWSMRAVGGESYAHRMSWTARDVVISAEVDGKMVAEKTIDRLYPWSDMNLIDLRPEGYVGELWLPPSQTDLPLLVVLGGFGSELDQLKASLLAARGFAVLDLVYHGKPPLPDALERIPLEYAKGAIEWASQQAGVDGTRVGVFGTSKGAEYALLLAATYSDIDAVAAWTPSSVAWAGISFTNPFTKSSWTYEGEDVPYVPSKVTAASLWRMIKMMTGQPVAFHDTYAAGLENDQAVGRASIKVENISGPILLVSGDVDRMWPAKRMCEMIIERLEQEEVSPPYRHLDFENVGHTFPWGQWPSPPPNSDIFIRGGEPEKNQAAGEMAWQETISHFQTALRSPE